MGLPPFMVPRMKEPAIALARFLVLFTGFAMLSARCPAAELVPFPWDWSQAHESALDLSRFLDAPAGKNGHVRVANGHFVKADGSRLRLWGVNIASTSCFPPKDQAPKIAQDLARLGFNVARFHHLDADWGECIFLRETNNTRVLDLTSFDKLDFFVSELKKRGIYSSFTMSVHRKFKEGDEVRDYKLLGIGKGATFFNPRLIELQHEFTRNFLTHKNPYTGNEYRYEPAVLSVEMVNENSLLEAWCQWRLVGRDDKPGETWSPIPVSYGNELTEQYNAWLSKKRSPEQMTLLRAEAKTDALIPRLTPAEFTNASHLRFHSEAEFLCNVESNFFAGMKQLIRGDLGAKCLLLGSGDHNDGFAAYAHVRNMMQFDLVDGHGYWEHPDIGKVTKIKNTPMVNDPLESTFTQFARSPVAGYPFTIAEVNHPFPHDYAAEGYVTLAAYALLHDWDGIIWFDWEQGRMAPKDVGIRRNGWFDVSQDPVKLAQLTAAGLMWHRRDVAKAKETIVRKYSPDEMVEAMRLVGWKHRPFFKTGFDLTTPLKHATRWEVALDNSAPSSSSQTPTQRQAPGAIASDTGELHWLGADKKEGVVKITTPATHSLIGFASASGAQTPHLALNISNAFCAVTLTSLTSSDIASSSKLLLVATTGAAKNTGQRFEADGKTLAEWGQGPIQIEPITGSLQLRGLSEARAARAVPLSPEGRMLEADAVALKGGDGGWTLPLGKPATTWWLIEVAR